MVQVMNWYHENLGLDVEGLVALVRESLGAEWAAGVRSHIIADQKRS